MTVRVIVMGVAGSGKTSVGRRLAERLGARFLDADDAHPEANIAKMADGLPLVNAYHWPWLERMQRELADRDEIVLACSALKRSYRDVLRGAGDVRFVYLEIGRPDVLARVTARSDHFMKSEMVASQFATLEPPGPSEPDVVTVVATDGLDSVVEAAISGLRAVTVHPPD